MSRMDHQGNTEESKQFLDVQFTEYNEENRNIRIVLNDDFLMKKILKNIGSYKERYKIGLICKKFNNLCMDEKTIVPETGGNQYIPEFSEEAVVFRLPLTRSLKWKIVYENGWLELGKIPKNFGDVNNLKKFEKFLIFYLLKSTRLKIGNISLKLQSFFKNLKGFKRIRKVFFSDIPTSNIGLLNAIFKNKDFNATTFEISFPTNNEILMTSPHRINLFIRQLAAEKIEFPDSIKNINKTRPTELNILQILLNNTFHKKFEEFTIFFEGIVSICPCRIEFLNEICENFNRTSISFRGYIGPLSRDSFIRFFKRFPMLSNGNVKLVLCINVNEEHFDDIDVLEFFFNAQRHNYIEIMYGHNNDEEDQNDHVVEDQVSDNGFLAIESLDICIPGCEKYIFEASENVSFPLENTIHSMKNLKSFSFDYTIISSSSYFYKICQQLNAGVRHVSMSVMDECDVGIFKTLSECASNLEELSISTIKCDGISWRTVVPYFKKLRILKTHFFEAENTLDILHDLKYKKSDKLEYPPLEYYELSFIDRSNEEYKECKNALLKIEKATPRKLGKLEFRSEHGLIFTNTVYIYDNGRKFM